MNYKAKCPSCKDGGEIVGYDRVIALAQIAGWTKDKYGDFDPDWAGETEIDWNSQSPHDHELPYLCTSCSQCLAESDLIFEEDTDDDE